MRSCGRRERNLYTAAMAVPPYRFSTYVGNLCVTRGTDVFKLGAKLGIDPIELLRMINGKVAATKAVTQ
jgi:hypothetical protein